MDCVSLCFLFPFLSAIFSQLLLPVPVACIDNIPLSKELGDRPSIIYHPKFNVYYVKIWGKDPRAPAETVTSVSCRIFSSDSFTPRSPTFLCYNSSQPWDTVDPGNLASHSFGFVSVISAKLTPDEDPSIVVSIFNISIPDQMWSLKTEIVINYQPETGGIEASPFVQVSPKGLFPEERIFLLWAHADTLPVVATYNIDGTSLATEPIQNSPIPPFLDFTFVGSPHPQLLFTGISGQTLFAFIANPENITNRTPLWNLNNISAPLGGNVALGAFKDKFVSCWYGTGDPTGIYCRVFGVDPPHPPIPITKEFQANTGDTQFGTSPGISLVTLQDSFFVVWVESGFPSQIKGQEFDLDGNQLVGDEILISTPGKQVEMGFAEQEKKVAANFNTGQICVVWGSHPPPDARGGCLNTSFGSSLTTTASSNSLPPSSFHSTFTSSTSGHSISTTNEMKDALTPSSDPLSTFAVISGIVVLIGSVVFLLIAARVFTKSRRKMQEVELNEPTDPAEDADISDLHDVCIDYTELELDNLLGEGQFGAVYKGTYHGNDCVVKTLKKSSTTEVSRQRDELLKEVTQLRKLRPHASVCAFFGACIDPEKPLAIVLEYITGGNLLQLIKNPANPDPFSKLDFLSIMKDIAGGMSHLHGQMLCHGDLAARNCLVVGKNPFRAKICDFGLSRVLPSKDPSACIPTSGNMIPVRWSAPETYQHETFYYGSDVWGFGVVAWECLSKKIPYDDLGTNAEVMEFVQSGNRLPEPEQHWGLYSLLLECWEADPQDRPTFRSLSRKFTRLVKEELEEHPLDDPDDNLNTAQVVVEGVGVEGAYEEAFSSRSQTYLFSPSQTGLDR